MSTMVTGTVVRSTPRWTPTSGAAVGGAALFFAATLVTGALTPGYSLIRESISGLAAADNRAGGLMIAGFVACAVAFLSTGVLFWQRFAGITSGRVAAVMTGVAGLGMAVAGFARQDCSEYRAGCIDAGEAPLASTQYWVHEFVSLGVFLTMTVMTFVLARALRRSALWSYLAVPTRAVGALLVIGTVGLVVVEFGDYNGVAQRAYVALMMGWPVAVAVLTSRSRDRAIG